MSKNETLTLKKNGGSRWIWVLVVLVLSFSWVVELYPFVISRARIKNFGFGNQKLEDEEIVRINSVVYWKSVLDKQPSYQRAYLELAILAAEAGDITNSKIYLESAVAIDPNNADNKSVERFIESKELFWQK